MLSILYLDRPKHRLCTGLRAVPEKNVILLRIVALTGTSAATSEFSGLLRRSATQS